MAAPLLSAALRGARAFGTAGETGTGTGLGAASGPGVPAGGRGQARGKHVREAGGGSVRPAPALGPPCGPSALLGLSVCLSPKAVPFSSCSLQAGGPAGPDAERGDRCRQLGGAGEIPQLHPVLQAGREGGQEGPVVEDVPAVRQPRARYSREGLRGFVVEGRGLCLLLGPWVGPKSWSVKT